jgi:hypothetical protein
MFSRAFARAEVGAIAKALPNIYCGFCSIEREGNYIFFGFISFYVVRSLQVLVSAMVLKIS